MWFTYCPTKQSITKNYVGKTLMFIVYIYPTRSNFFVFCYICLFCTCSFNNKINNFTLFLFSSHEPKISWGIVVALHPSSSAWPSASIKSSYFNLFLSNYRSKFNQTWKKCHCDGHQHYLWFLFHSEFQHIVFNPQRARHSSNMLPTMIHGQNFRIITWFKKYEMDQNI